MDENHVISFNYIDLPSSPMAPARIVTLEAVFESALMSIQTVSPSELYRSGQTEIDSRPFTLNTLCPGFSPMTADNTVHNGKTYPGALKLCLTNEVCGRAKTSFPHISGRTLPHCP